MTPKLMYSRFSGLYRAFLSFSILPFLLLGCQSASVSPPSPSSTANNAQTLKLLSWQAPTILNPHLSTGFKDAEASRITLEPLATFDKNGQLIPFLAAEIPSLANGGLSKDGKSVIWKLRSDIKWSDGTPFTAQDVVFTYQFITNPKVGSTSAGTYEAVKQVEALDRDRVKITFKEANPAWFLPFVGSEGVILPRHQFAQYSGEKARQAPANLLPVGTGPYKVVQFKPGDIVIYEPNPHFREAKTLGFQRIELKGGGDATSAARAVLQTNDADYAFNLQVEAPILKELEAAGKGQVLANLGSLSERISLNLSDRAQAAPQGSKKVTPHPFLEDKKVREAFTLAVDRQTIAQQLYGITGQATSNVLLLPKEYDSPHTQYEFDLKKAANLLDEAGWKDTNGNGIRDKKGVEMNVVFQTTVNPLRQKTQQVIKQGLQSLGVNVELKSIDASIFFSSDPANTDTVERFNADLQMYTTGNSSPDPGKYMKTFTCAAIPTQANNWAGDNYGRHCNPEYDQLWQRSQRELDPKKRQQLFIQMNDLLIQNAILIPLVHRADVVGVSNRLSGVDLTPWDRNTWNISQWKRSS
ncbi:MAG: peptide ABC transporter substrate-binding protein [Snowella sp.]|nr:peptide ABC transporter substrate-binding protein [Snowella sp.]